MKCILHIGTEKTGTTSLQRFFSEHRDVIRARGLWYPSSLGLRWHRELAVYAMPSSRPDDAFKTLGIANATQHSNFREKLKREFESDFKSIVNADYCLISSEHLHSRLRNAEEISAVREFLTQYFDDFLVIAHLRPQVEVLVSLASTAARVQIIVDSEYFQRADMESMYFDYDALLAAWGDVFGKENILPVSFKKQPSMVDFVSELVGVKFDDLGKPGRENSALDVEVIALLNAVKRKGVNVSSFAGVIGTLPVRERILLSISLAHAIHERCAASNRRVAMAFNQICVNDLEPDYSKYVGEGNLHLLDGACDFPNALADFFERSREAFEVSQQLRKS